MNTRPLATGSVPTEAGREGRVPVLAASKAAPGGAHTPTEGLTKGELAPMADSNPTGVDDVVALTIPSDHQRFLRSVFQMALGGIRDELGGYPDDLREPARLYREEAVYDTLLAALDCGSIVVTGDTRCVLRDLAGTIDRANEYDRVVAEHAALLGLREQVSAPTREAS